MKQFAIVVFKINTNDNDYVDKNIRANDIVYDSNRSLNSNSLISAVKKKAFIYLKH